MSAAVSDTTATSASAVVAEPSYRAEGANSGVGPTLRSDLVAELVAHADTAAVEAAEAVLAEAEERLRAAQATAAAADDVAAKARAEMPRLVERAFAGEAVEPQTIAAVHQRVRDAEAYASFTGAVVRRASEPVAAAKAELAEARHQAWTPVLEAAIQMRIDVARRVDRARLAAQGGTSHTPAQLAELEAAKTAAFEAVRPRYEAACEAVRVAVQNGLRPYENRYMVEPQFPAREASERAFWDKPLTAEEFVRASA